MQLGDMIGTISGDHLSPGGMQGHFEITVFVAYDGENGLKVYIRRLQVAKEKLVPVDVPLPLPTSIGHEEDGKFDPTTIFIEYDLGQ